MGDGVNEYPTREAVEAMQEAIRGLTPLQRAGLKRLLIDLHTVGIIDEAGLLEAFRLYPELRKA